jgi:hypothetical protein
MLKYKMDKRIKLRLCITAFLAGLQVFAQAQDQQLLQQFNAYGEQAMQEKLYMHTDKNFYLAGEICWFKIYNVDGFFNKPLGISKVAYVEVLDKNNKPVLQAKVAMKDGAGNGSLQLPVTLGSGKYLIRTYTRWMKNFSAAYFFEKPITVINSHKIYDEAAPASKKITYDVQFFPEGGNMVNAIQSKIAFRVVDQNGKSVACTGAVVNEKSDTIIKFATLKFGMGSFLFTPEQAHTYNAVLTTETGDQSVQPLPAAYSSGYVMHLEKVNNSQLKITVHSTADAGSGIVYLFAHTRGLVKEAISGTLRNNSFEFLIDTARLGPGISHFTVFNANRQPVCERLFFKKPKNHLEIFTSSDMALYEQRKKVAIAVASNDQADKPVAADMSMAVYRVDSLSTPDDADISSYLWLSSDLAGNIESPAYYFSDQSAQAEQATDNLMMTQGWRRFRWEDILQNKKPSFEFTPEYKGHIVIGRIVNNANGQPQKNVETFLSVVSTRSQVRGAFSDDSGYVKFEMNHFYGNNEIIVQTAGEKAASRHVEIINPFANKFSGTVLPSFFLPANDPDELQDRNVSVQVQSSYNGNKLKQMVLPDIDTTAFYFKPDKTYLLDDYVRFTTVEEILREYVPEVNVRRRNGKFYLPVFDNTRREFFIVDPLILLDGVPVLDPDKIMSYDPLKMRKLEVLARMYFYGSMFFGGIINFTTYKGDLNGYELEADATVIDHETLQMQRKFFSPLYETKEQYQGRLPDFRNLLYWNASVKTNKDGRKQLEFYTSDIPGKYAVVLQGITADGKTGSKTIFFDVNGKDSVAQEK